MHSKKIKTAGKSPGEASGALIMLHGRGASADDILTIASELDVNGFWLIAPQATNSTWYPYSFLSLPKQNEPWLSSAIHLLDEIINDVRSNGISEDRIYFMGFSQGACLSLEYATRRAKRWGGVVAFTGGLIGDRLYTENYKGNFASTPVFIGSGDPDPHVPVQRVQETVEVLQEMNADVVEKFYKNMGHTITYEEIKDANEHVFSNKILRHTP